MFYKLYITVVLLLCFSSKWSFANTTSNHPSIKSDKEKSHLSSNRHCVSEACKMGNAKQMESQKSTKRFIHHKATPKAQWEERVLTQSVDSTLTKSTEPTQESANTIPLSENWKSIRFGTSTLDLYDNTKYCENKVNKMIYIKNNMLGDKESCMTKGRENISDVMNEEKRNVIKDKIIPAIQSAFANIPLIYHSKAPLVIQAVNEKCSQFNIPETHKSNGVPNTDVMLYISAAPVKREDFEGEDDESTDIPADEFNQKVYEKEIPLWAIPCASSNGRIAAIAINFNPVKIMDTQNTINAAKEEIKKIIGTSECPTSTNAVFFGDSTHKEKTTSGVCVSVKCEDESKVKVQQKDSTEWKDCNEGENIPLTGTSTSVKCPKFDEICSVKITANGEPSEKENVHTPKKDSETQLTQSTASSNDGSVDAKTPKGSESDLSVQKDNTLSAPTNGTEKITSDASGKESESEDKMEKKEEISSTQGTDDSVSTHETPFNGTEELSKNKNEKSASKSPNATNANKTEVLPEKTPNNSQNHSGSKEAEKLSEQSLLDELNVDKSFVREYLFSFLMLTFTLFIATEY